jgi:putative oxidoreductase
MKHLIASIPKEEEMETWIAEVWHSGFGGTDAVYAVLRTLVGVFFVLSGYHKLFNAKRHASLVETLQSCGIPCVRYMQWFVPSVEFFGGLGICFGFATVLAAAGLVFLLVVATCTDGLKRIPSEHPLDPADYVDCVLYLPEVLLICLLIIVLAGGGGPYSLDHLIYSYI